MKTVRPASTFLSIFVALSRCSQSNSSSNVEAAAKTKASLPPKITCAKDNDKMALTKDANGKFYITVSKSMLPMLTTDTKFDGYYLPKIHGGDELFIQETR